MNIKKELEVIMEQLDTIRMDIYHEYNDDDSYIDTDLLKVINQLEVIMLEVTDE